MIIVTLISTWFIVSPIVFRTSGVVVATMSSESQCGAMTLGDHISRVGTVTIKNLQQFEAEVSKAKKDQRTTLLVNYGPGGCVALEDGDLGITVSDIDDNTLKFGIDVYGGKRVKLDVSSGVSGEASLDEVKTLIENRADVVGGIDMDVKIEGGVLYIDTITTDDVPLLLQKGSIDGRLDQTVRLSEGEGQLKLGADYYDVSLKKDVISEEVEVIINESEIENSTDTDAKTTTKNETIQKTVYLTSSIVVNGRDYEVGEIFTLDDVRVEVLNITNSSIVLGAKVFENEDLAPLQGVSSYVRYEASIGEYQFFVPVELSEKAGRSFAKITDGMATIVFEETSLLEGTLVFLVDGREINRLTLPSTLTGEEMSSISLIGSGKTLEDALNKKTLIEVSMIGETDYDVVIDEITEYESGGAWMIYITFGVIVVAAAGMFIMPAVMFKGLKVSSLGILGAILVIFLSYNLFGIAALSQNVFSPGWIIDSVSVAGIVVSVLWVSLSMLSVAEKTVKRKDRRYWNYVSVAVVLIGFVSLFTSFNGFGVSVIYSIIIGHVLLFPSYKKSASMVQ
jgi:hypothetical protein